MGYCHPEYRFLVVWQEKQTSSSRGLRGSERASGSCRWGALPVQSSRTRWLGAHIEHLLFRNSVRLGLRAQQDMHGRKHCPGPLFIAGDKGEAITSVLTHLPGSAGQTGCSHCCQPHLGTLKRKVCQLRAEISISRTYLDSQSRDPRLWTVINVGNPVASPLCSSHPRDRPGGGRAKLKLSIPW